MSRIGPARVGVAISTTGQPHRLAFLETAVTSWREALPLGSMIYVTVDGTEDDARAAMHVVSKAGPPGHIGGCTYRVGQPTPLWVGPGMREGRCGVAANKNTGLDLLMAAGCEQMFLADDDIHPLGTRSLTLHADLGYPHSMVCWGNGRLERTAGPTASWTWPRGVMLYVERVVVETVGGMDERFGAGGHEHAEWSRRIHQVGFTPAPFLSPAVYATRHGIGKAHGAAAFWGCEDMRKPGEQMPSLGARRKQITTISRDAADRERINKVMASRDGDTTFVPYSAYANGRVSSTLTPSQGARAKEPAMPEEIK